MQCKISHSRLLTLLVSLFAAMVSFFSEAHAQQPVYPIIFVHGINSSDETWKDTIEFYRDQFGWNDPYPNYQGIYHVVLNAYKGMTNIAGPDNKRGNFDDDVLFLIYDEDGNRVNDLYGGNIFAINYNNFWNEKADAALLKIHDSSSPGLLPGESSSNESAITKQAYALGRMIKQVITKSGSKKVILVAHSMGGLAAREYLQRTDEGGNPKWWAYPDEESTGHRVAKLVTIGTPHAGANSAENKGFLGINERAEAARDLTYNYYSNGSPNFAGNPDNGIYLFGGVENAVPSTKPNNPLKLWFINKDINCDGDINDIIKGLNSNTVVRFDNLDMPLPRNVDYTWIVSEKFRFTELFVGDGAVRKDRQYLNSVGDTLMTNRLHAWIPFAKKWETNDYKSILRGLDEPDTDDLAYEIQADKTYHIFSTRQSNNVKIDVDWLKLTPIQSGAYKFDVQNAPASNPSQPLKVELYRKDGANKLGLFAEATAQPYQDFVEIYGSNDRTEDIYIRIETESDANSWQNPMFVSWKNIGPATTVSLQLAASALPALPNSETMLTARLLDSQGQLNTGATNPITFAITSGTNSAKLVGNTTINAVNGVATIQLQATTVPGLVTIEATSPGLQKGQALVNVYGNPTEVAGNITANTTWGVANSPFVLIGDVRVKPGVILTIEPGVVVRGKANTDIFVEGGLMANATAERPIIFEGADQALPGSWGGIRFESSAMAAQCVLNHVVIRHAAQGGYGNNGAPIALSAYVDPTVTNTTLEKNKINGIQIDAGTYTSNISLSITGLPYIVSGDLTINAGAVLTIAAGALFKMWPGSDFYIKGGLLARGNPTNRIVFTSYRDDSRAGDTNGDGGSAAVASDWGGIGFYRTIDDQQTRLDYVDVNYAAQGGYGNLPAPIYIELAANPGIQAVRLFNNRINGIQLQTGSFTSDVRILNYDLPMIISGDVAIRNGAKLTIDPGVLFKMWPGADFYIEGTLIAEGTPAKPITFTSYRDDSIFGDTNVDGETAGVSGDFGGIRFTGSSTGSRLRYWQIYFGGGGGYGNIGNPLQVDPRAEVSMQNMQLDNCTSNGVNIIPGNYLSNTQLNITDLPYTMNGDFTVGEGTTLTILPGVSIKLWPGSDFFVKGTLDASGTEMQAITLTSYRDDSILGDTNNDGSTTAVAGDWSGIRFYSTSTGSKLIHTRLTFAGGGGYGNLGVPILVDARSNPIFQFVEIENSTSNGINILAGTYQTDILFDQTALPYTVSGDISISESASLSIVKGTHFKMWPGTDFYIRGNLSAIGTESDSIIFTSYRDDSLVGDTNNDGQSKGVRGDWGGIRFIGERANISQVKFISLKFGASGGYGNNTAALVFDRSSPAIEHSSIMYTRGSGVEAYNGASPDFGGGSHNSNGGNQFIGFLTDPNRFAINNVSPAEIFAKFNYWETNSDAAIEAHIFDQMDRADRGRVLYSPFVKSSDTEAPKLAIIVPRAGESLAIDSIYTVAWAASDNVALAGGTLSLSRDGGKTFAFIDSVTSSQRQYDWLVPRPPTHQGVLKIEMADKAGNRGFAISEGVFAIFDPSSGENLAPSIPSPISPVLGEELRPGGLLIWYASRDPNVYDQVDYYLQVDNDVNFASPEIYNVRVAGEFINQKDLNSANWNQLSPSAASTPVQGNAVAVMLDTLSGYEKLQDNTVYFWRVRSQDNRGGLSGFSDGKAHFFFNKINSAPEAVTAGFSPREGTELRLAQPELSWHPAEDPDLSDHSGTLSYNLELHTSSDFTAPRLHYQTAQGLATFEVPDSLDENRTWFWRVQTVDDDSLTSDWSEIQTFVVNAVDEAPADFDLLSPLHTQTVSEDTLLFTWRHTTDPDPNDRILYSIEISPDSLFQLNPIRQSLNDTTFKIPANNLKKGVNFWRVTALDTDSLITWASQTDTRPWKFTLLTTGVRSENSSSPQKYELLPAYPNPFNPETRIAFTVPWQARVTLSVFNALGQLVETLYDKTLEAGVYTSTWSATRADGRVLPSGVYIVVLRAENFVQTQKIVLLR